MFGERVDKRSYAVLQQMFCSFSPGISFGKEAEKEYLACKQKKELGKTLSVDQEISLILPMVFGNFGCKIDLERAWREAEALGIRLMVKKTALLKIDAKRFWYDTGNVSILMGIIGAYLDDFVLSAKCFLLGLKTEAINLNAPTCDFIKYVLSKIPSYAEEEASYSGCGFTPDDVMGPAYGNRFDGTLALRNIPKMQGRNGEIIVAFQGQRGLYGFLERRGSTRCDKLPHPVDIYETYLIDEEDNVKKIKLYFNNYFDYEAPLKCADGFFFAYE
jgi:hypothetical protein